MIHSARFSFLPACLLGCALLFTGCDKKGAGGPPGGGMGPGGPVEVGVLTVATASVSLAEELPGRVSALRVAEVRARVDGIVLKRHFEEGAEVKEGQLLYEIDPAPYQAALDSAQGTVAKANANIAGAKAREERFKKLLTGNAVSRQEYDDAVASMKTFEADALSGAAAVRAAQINLDYTKVTSPISGRIGISQVTEGAYVQSGTATLLATVQQLDRVYVDVTRSAGEILRLKRDLAEGKLKADAEGQAKVKLLLADGQAYPEEGALQVSDVTVQPTTSSVTIRAVFPNPRGDLLPGMFVRASLQEGKAPEAILVPQSAVTRNTKGEPTTMLVGAEDKAEVRVLHVSRAVGNQWLVTDGLKVGDRVILNNLQRIRPGAPVKPAPANAAAAAAAAAPATAAAPAGK